MFSNVKNFFLTFVLALVIFGLVASAVVSLVISNINESLNRSEETAETTSGNSSGDVTPGEEAEDDSQSLNILLIGTDYREGIFPDYDPEMLKTLYGIEQKTVSYEAAPEDIGVPSDIAADDIINDAEYDDGSGYKLDENTLIFNNGFYSVDYRTVSADTVILIRLDRERKQLSVTAFPTEAYMTVKGRSMRMSDIYASYGVTTLCDAIHSLTGLVVDRYVCVTMDAFPDIIDSLGGVEYTVPCNMKYDDYSAGLHIDLKAGKQLLDGESALEMLMFKDYTDGTNTRQNTAVNFVKTLMKSLIVQENLSKLPGMFEALGENIDTDITVKDISDNLPLALKCMSDTSDIIQINAVTSKSTVYGETAYVFDLTKTRTVFSSYKKLFD